MHSKSRLAKISSFHKTNNKTSSLFFRKISWRQNPQEKSKTQVDNLNKKKNEVVGKKAKQRRIQITTYRKLKLAQIY